MSRRKRQSEKKQAQKKISQPVEMIDSKKRNKKRQTQEQQVQAIVETPPVTQVTATENPAAVEVEVQPEIQLPRHRKSLPVASAKTQEETKKPAFKVSFPRINIETLAKLFPDADISKLINVIETLHRCNRDADNGEITGTKELMQLDHDLKESSKDKAEKRKQEDIKAQHDRNIASKELEHKQAMELEKLRHENAMAEKAFDRESWILRFSTGCIFVFFSLMAIASYFILPLMLRDYQTLHVVAPVVIQAMGVGAAIIRLLLAKSKSKKT